MSKYSLLQGDCLTILPQIPSTSIDLVLCDLPYGTTASTWDKAIPMDRLWEQYKRLIKPNGVIVLFASGIFVPRVILTNLPWYKYMWIWVKSNSGNFVHAKNRPLTKHEQILVFSPAPMGHKSQLGDKRMTYNPQGLIPCHQTIKAGKGRFGTVAGVRPSQKTEFEREYTNYPTDVLMEFPEVAASKKLHTNEKPIPLLEYLIKTYTDEGALVLDNCMGSGSCGIACQNTNRNFLGIELDEKYYNITKERMEKNDIQ